MSQPAVINWRHSHFLCNQSCSKTKVTQFHAGGVLLLERAGQLELKFSKLISRCTLCINITAAFHLQFHVFSHTQSTHHHHEHSTVYVKEAGEYLACSLYWCIPSSMSENEVARLLFLVIRLICRTDWRLIIFLLAGRWWHV